MTNVWEIEVKAAMARKAVAAKIKGLGTSTPSLTPPGTPAEIKAWRGNLDLKPKGTISKEIMTCEFHAFCESFGRYITSGDTLSQAARPVDVVGLPKGTQFFVFKKNLCSYDLP